MGNERVYRSLKRSLLCGTSVVGPELAVAILTVLFHYLNTKRKGEKHFKNYHVVPDVPLENDQAANERTANRNDNNLLNYLMNIDVTAKKTAKLSIESYQLIAGVDPLRSIDNNIQSKYQCRH